MWRASEIPKIETLLRSLGHSDLRNDVFFPQVRIMTMTSKIIECMCVLDSIKEKITGE